MRCFFPALGILLALGCAAQAPSSPIPAERENVIVRSQVTDITYELLYKFKAKSDGAFPLGPLMAAEDGLYGTTSAGGGGSGKCDRGCGTIFRWQNGSERVVYRFRGAPDGAGSNAGLVAFGGKYYGTTASGGEGPAYCSLGKTRGCGTVFSITKVGTESIVYRFKGAADGFLPYGGLVVLRNELFGTTSAGGTPPSNKPSAGTVFALRASGEKRVVHRFGQQPGDGIYPDGTLIVLDGKLYGTTDNGGTSGNCPLGCGTVFVVTRNGQERVLHSFGRGGDGALPWAGLTAWRGVLYGTTTHGGPQNDGTIFAITPSGRERVVYAFRGGSDGALPYGAVLVLNGNLYGTTQFGGEFDKGTIFEVGPSGYERTLYSFSGGAAGAYPGSSLVEFNNRAFGTTVFGGKYVPLCGRGNGCGAIFSLKL